MRSTDGSSITFFVPGEPKGQPRARAFAMKRGDKTYVRMYDPSTAEGWKNLVAGVARPHLPLHPPLGPVSLSTVYTMPRPRGHFGSGRNACVLKPNAPQWHIGKPDIDNLDKAVMDCLTNLGFWKDDCQVCMSPQRMKVYGEQAGVLIAIEYLPGVVHAHPRNMVAVYQKELI